MKCVNDEISFYYVTFLPFAHFSSPLVFLIFEAPQFRFESECRLMLPKSLDREREREREREQENFLIEERG